MQPSDVLRIPAGNVLNEMIEVMIFNSEREHLNFSRKALIQINGKISKARNFSDSDYLYPLILRQLNVMKKPYSIDYFPEDDLCYRFSFILPGGESCRSTTIELAICKCCILQYWREHNTLELL